MARSEKRTLATNGGQLEVYSRDNLPEGVKLKEEGISPIAIRPDSTMDKEIERLRQDVLVVPSSKKGQGEARPMSRSEFVTDCVWKIIRQQQEQRVSASVKPSS